MITVEKQQPKTYARVRCSNKTYLKVSEIADDCDLTINQVVSSLLEYALSHSRVIKQEKTITENKLIIGGCEYNDDNNQQT